MDDRVYITVGKNEVLKTIVDVVNWRYQYLIAVGEWVWNNNKPNECGL